MHFSNAFKGAVDDLGVALWSFVYFMKVVLPCLLSILFYFAFLAVKKEKLDQMRVLPV